MLTLRDAIVWGCQVESCESCGADLGPSPSFVWHYLDEDCRAIKDPVVVIVQLQTA